MNRGHGDNERVHETLICLVYEKYSRGNRVSPYRRAMGPIYNTTPDWTARQQKHPRRSAPRRSPCIIPTSVHNPELAASPLPRWMPQVVSPHHSHRGPRGIGASPRRYGDHICLFPRVHPKEPKEATCLTSKSTCGGATWGGDGPKRKTVAGLLKKTMQNPP